MLLWHPLCLLYMQGLIISVDKQTCAHIHTNTHISRICSGLFKCECCDKETGLFNALLTVR